MNIQSTDVNVIAQKIHKIVCCQESNVIKLLQTKDKAINDELNLLNINLDECLQKLYDQDHQLQKILFDLDYLYLKLIDSQNPYHHLLDKLNQ